MAYDQAVNAYNSMTGLNGGSQAAGAGAIGISYAADHVAPPPPVSAITDAHRMRFAERQRRGELIKFAGHDYRDRARR